MICINVHFFKVSIIYMTIEYGKKTGCSIVQYRTVSVSCNTRAIKSVVLIASEFSSGYQMVYFFIYFCSPLYVLPKHCCDVRINHARHYAVITMHTIDSIHIHNTLGNLIIIWSQ
jgi:hypothetical protein